MTKIITTMKGLAITDDEGQAVYFTELTEDEREAFGRAVQIPEFWSAFINAFKNSLVEDTPEVAH